ncbi:Kinesin-4 protein [Spatholobus suberectus]|nr:Kinesin-4 protein [Spatholobus suberectus]
MMVMGTSTWARNVATMDKELAGEGDRACGDDASSNDDEVSDGSNSGNGGNNNGSDDNDDDCGGDGGSDGGDDNNSGSNGGDSEMVVVVVAIMVWHGGGGNDDEVSDGSNSGSGGDNNGDDDNDDDYGGGGGNDGGDDSNGGNSGGDSEMVVVATMVAVEIRLKVYPKRMYKDGVAIFNGGVICVRGTRFLGFLLSVMEDGSRNRTRDFNMASRKAEEAAWRRYEATQWLESQVGPLGISNQPTEREIISCLRNGLILCNAINKIHPGAVPKVVVNQVASQSLTWDSQPLPAYQYFENVRNFLVAMEELKLPAFEASDLERDTLEMGSAAKVVDCILALKSFQELKQMNNQNGYNKHIKSPLPMRSISRMHSRAAAAFPSDACRHLDLSATLEKMPPSESNFPKREEIVELLVEQLVARLFDAKENIDGNIIASLRNEHLVMDPINVFNQIMACCNGEQPPARFYEDIVEEKSSLPVPHSTSAPTQSDSLSIPDNSKHCQACPGKCKCNQEHLLDMQEKELLDLKALKLKIKKEFEEMQSQFQGFFNDIGSQIQDMSTKALGYQRVVEENRKLYNMVQDLKGNIRVYCRIRPSFRPELKNVVDFIGEDGSLFILDPTKTLKDGRKLFRFNRVFDPTAGQDEVYKDTRPLIRSVMDGYNVCIFAYGQTGSGKTHTMSGPSGGTSKDMGINYLALNDLFQMSNERKDIIKYDIYVQMVEIYNEQVRDLLAADKTDNKYPFHIHYSIGCNDDGLSLPDARLRSVKSTTDVMTLMKLGEVNRAVSSTAMNNRSSRSHSVLTVHVHGKDTSGSSIRSCLHLVDLAGSERVDKSEVTGERLKEAQFINKSLSCLGDVITALAQKNSHIPYRNSKLTLLLQDSLGGHAKTLMFAHVSPDADSFGETVSTLKFAQRVSAVELGAARLNKESSEVMQLKEQVENLKIALATKEAQRAMFNRIKESHTPLEKPTLVSEKTPFRPRRLSIENCSTVKTDKSVNREDRSGAKSPPLLPRSRRLSLEGSKTIKKDSSQPKVSDDIINKALQYEPVSWQKYHPMQDPESVSKLNGHFSSGNSRSELHAKTPRSPTSISYQKRLVKVNGGMQVHPLKLPQTPEPPVLDGNDAHGTKVMGSTNGKGSQIRRSLRTIGKLINGPDKRSQQNMVEFKSPIKGTDHTKHVKSPISAVEKTKRRQSLTGIQAPLPNNSRRSSLGGKPVVAYDKDTNARTPPTHLDTKTAKRWL